MGNINKNDTLKASFWYLVSNMLLKGVAFLTIPLFARLLTKTEFGYYNNFTAWLGILTILVTLSLHASLVRARFDYKDELVSFVSSNLLFGSGVTLLFFLASFLTRDLWIKIFAMDYKYLAFIFLVLLFYPAYLMFQQIQRFEYKYKLVVAITVIVSISSVALSFLLIAILEDDLSARILGAQIPIMLSSMIIYFYFLYRGHKFKISYCRYSFVMCLPYVIHLLANTLLSSIDRVMITNMCGPESTALYGMAYNIAMIVTVLLDSLNSAYSPWLGEQLHIKNYEGIKKYSYAYIAVFAFILLGVMLAAPEALYILGGESYMSAKYVIPPVMMGYMFVFLYTLYVNIEQYEKKTVGMACATVVAAVLNLVLNAIMIPRFGYIAAAYTTLIGYVFLFVFHYLLVKRMKLDIVYDTKYIVLVMTIMLILSAAVYVLYIHNVTRYIVLGIYVVFCGITGMKNKDYLLKLIKK